MQPVYPTPWPLIFRLAHSVVFRQKLSFQLEAKEAVSRIKPPLKILREENIPSQGPCLLTVNHYFRPGFGAWWIPLGIAASLPMQSHWMMASAWTYPNLPFGKQKEAVTHWAFKRVAIVLGLTSMPPMPPRPHEALARAQAVRQVLSYARQHPQAVIGIAPEGGDSPTGVLAMPAPGVGRFIFHLTRFGLSIIPVGAFEADGAFCLNFGQKYILRTPDHISAQDLDNYVRQVVMNEIARVVPRHLRGPFSEVINLCDNRIEHPSINPL